MKIFLFVSLFMLTFSFAAYSQTNESAKCSEIQIYGPAGPPIGQQEVEFSASVENAEGKNLYYNWTSSAGEIIKGQGTPNITVRQMPELGNITVVVEITGLPEGCPNTIAETLMGDCLQPESILVDEFSVVPQRIDKASLDYLISKMQEDSNTQIYIIENFAPGTTEAVIKRKLTLIKNYILKIRRQDASRFTFVTGNMNGNKTQFWIVPQGAMPPTP